MVSSVKRIKVMRLLSEKQMEILKNHLEKATGNDIQEMICPICHSKGFRTFASPLDGIKGAYFSDYKLLKSEGSDTFCVVVVVPCTSCGFMFQFDSNMVFDVNELFE